MTSRRTFRTLASFTVSLACLFASNSARAEAIGKISLPPGFRAELVYAVPLVTQGSWISLAIDDRGRLIASDQSGGLYRITPAPLGHPPEETRIESIPVAIGMAHGLLFHKGKLYVMQNGQLGSFTSGLYCVSDTDGDDQFDKVELIRVFEGEGEHGPHAVLLGPDGKLYVCCGNFTQLPLYDRTLPAPVWGEDQLLPRLYDPNGHAVEIKVPGGWIARMDPDGSNLELVSVGYRNMYDLAFNHDGELFTFDSDMEWDIGTPWYRPTRLIHVVPGTDFGWRTGNGVMPDYYVDTAPAAINVGPTSPTGLAFGREAKFPEKYQHALFAGDWSYGNIYVFHLAPKGSTYGGTFERFASAMPLGVTDLLVRPQDGALYFTVGGRGSQSALYRIVYDQKAATSGRGPGAADDSSTPTTTAAAPERTSLHALESLLAGEHADAVPQLWPYLSNPDRMLRYIARAVLDHQPLASWRAKALAEANVDAQLPALVALARVGSPGDQADYVRAIAGFDFDKLDHRQRLDLLRAAALDVLRLGKPTPQSRGQLLAAFDKKFPTGDAQVDRELSHLLVALHAPKIVDRLLPLLEQAVTQEESLDVAVTLSAARAGWSMDQRRQFLEWFQKASRSSGGNSYFQYMVAVRDRFIGGFAESERETLAELVDKPLQEQTPAASTIPRRFVRSWTLDEAVAAAEKTPGPRDYGRGRKLFSAALCYNCHRVAGEGSSVGPDLTGVGGRFGVRDIVKSILDPNAVISDQYKQLIFNVGGQVITGRIVNIGQNNEVVVSANMLNPRETVRIRRQDVDDEQPSPISVMPTRLLDTLTAEEIADLTTFLRSAGRRDSPLYGETPAKR